MTDTPLQVEDRAQIVRHGLDVDEVVRIRTGERGADAV